MMKSTGMSAIIRRGFAELWSRPVYLVCMLLIPLFVFFFLADMMRDGLPTRVPAAIVDKDQTALSHSVTQTLDGMQLVSLQEECNSFTEARHLMQEGKIFGFFLIPENFESDLLSGRQPEITFYTNMTYYVPGTLLYKTFKTTAVYTKAGVAVKILEDLGGTKTQIMPKLQPVNIEARPLGNPQLNYAIYLCNSFIPGVLQLMILLVTCFSLGREEKTGSSLQLMQMAGGNIGKALIGKLLPQTLIWMALAMFMLSWLFGWNHYPMHGSWWWMGLSTFLFVLASQGLGVFFFGLLPNLRLSLSISALVGILTFSLAAFSFPTESMYGAVSIFSWITPVRYYFLIYIDQALNGIDIFYSRYWFIAYFVFILLPLTVLRRIRRTMEHPVYVP